MTFGGPTKMTETCLEYWKRRKPHFTCPRCGATSWNLNDVAHLYCGRCHVFAAPHVSLRDSAPRDDVGVARARKRAEEALRPSSSSSDDDTPSPFTFSPSPDPPAAPDPPAFDPGGGSSGGGGASGDW
jgi:uncharacterized membrane protein YgcG